MTILERLERQVAESGDVDLDALGAISVALVDEVATSPYFDLVAARLAEAWPDSEDGAQRDWLLRGFATNNMPNRVADALDAVLGSPQVVDDAGRDLAGVLLGRTSPRGDPRSALIAAVALEGATRLALGGYANRHAVLAVLTEVSASDNLLFAARAARLLGVAYDAWPGAEIREALERVAGIAGAEADASVELGMTHLRDAVAAGSEASVRQSLVAALAWFERAVRTEEDRDDATALRLVCEILLDLAAGASAETLAPKVDDLRASAVLQALYLSDAPRSWLRPRATTAIEMSRLLEALEQARRLVGQPSWYRPAEALEATLDAYVALRSVEVVVRSEARPLSGIASIVEPAIDAGFIRYEGLRQHLRDWLQEAASQGDVARREAARTVLARVESGQAGQRPFRPWLS